MPQIACPKCQGQLVFPDGIAARKVQCPTCGHIFLSSDAILPAPAPSVRSLIDPKTAVVPQIPPIPPATPSATASATPSATPSATAPAAKKVTPPSPGLKQRLAPSDGDMMFDLAPEDEPDVLPNQPLTTVNPPPVPPPVKPVAKAKPVPKAVVKVVLEVDEAEPPRRKRRPLRNERDTDEDDDDEYVDDAYEDDDEEVEYEESIDRFLWARRGLMSIYFGLICLIASLVLYLVAFSMARLGTADNVGETIMRCSVIVGMLGFSSMMLGFLMLCAGPVKFGALYFAIGGTILGFAYFGLMLPRTGMHPFIHNQLPRSFVTSFVPIVVGLDMFSAKANITDTLREFRRTKGIDFHFASGIVELAMIAMLMGFLASVGRAVGDRTMRNQANQLMIGYPLGMLGIGIVALIILQIGLATQSGDLNEVLLTLVAFVAIGGMAIVYFLVMQMTRIGMDACDPRRW